MRIGLATCKAASVSNVRGLPGGDVKVSDLQVFSFQRLTVNDRWRRCNLSRVLQFVAEGCRLI
jgi:hypothetical protein